MNICIGTENVIHEISAIDGIIDRFMSSSNKESVSTYLSGMDAFYRDDPDTTTWCTEEEWNELPGEVVLPPPPSGSPTVVVARPAPWQAALWAQLNLDLETPRNKEALVPSSDKVDTDLVMMLEALPHDKALEKDFHAKRDACTGDALPSALKNKRQTKPSNISPATEWHSLHRWWRDFRARKKVTFARLFELCGESENPSYYEYLIPSGINKKVSMEPGSLGVRVTALLNKAKSIDETTINFPPLTSQELVRDVAEDARLILVMKGIFIVDLVTINLSDDVDHDFIEVDVLESGTPPVTAEGVLALIREYALEPHLDPTLQVVINHTQYLNRSE